MKLEIFYSYSHEDIKYRDEIEKTLSQLKRDFKLLDFSDCDIVPGQEISDKIKEKLDSAHICLFLFSRDFIDSKSCKEEWEYAKKISENRTIFRIPIILSKCAWEDYLKNDDVKVLPKDGKPLEEDSSKGYDEIYKGIKKVLEYYENCFTLRKDFKEEIRKTEFISQSDLKIEDIFVFPRLEEQTNSLSLYSEIQNESDIFSKKYVLISGAKDSGKTTLCRHLFLHLSETHTPVLLIDLEEIKEKKPSEKIFNSIYEKQFNGDYKSWKNSNKELFLIFDNLSNNKNSIKHVIEAKSIFDKARIIISVSLNELQAFFKDDTRLAEFVTIIIRELSRVKLEKLIKNRLKMMKGESVSHEEIDFHENRILDIVNKGLLPKYPFVILSIIQTFEAYMPDNLKISSYGHCYRALITAHLVQSGVENTDSDLGSCFNFLEHYAFYIYNSKKSESSLANFKENYDKDFIIKENLFNRMKSGNHPILENDSYRANYAYYYFLGAYLAKSNDNKLIIEKLVQKNYIKENNLIILFLLHHTSNVKIIEEIILHNMCALDNFEEAKLNKEETNIFFDFLNVLPDKIKSNKSVDEERESQRENIDLEERSLTEDDNEQDSNIKEINDIYRILKNNEIFSQILRNHYGNLKKTVLKNIVETTISSGLRLLKILLLEEKHLEDLVRFVRSKKPDSNNKNYQKIFQSLYFSMIIINIIIISNSISVKEIKSIVKEVLNNYSTPACDLIGYFSVLNTCDKFSISEKNEFFRLYGKYEKDKFVSKVLSLVTQNYFNTHKVKYDIKQSVYSKLNIPYTRLGWRLN